ESRSAKVLRSCAARLLLRTLTDEFAFRRISRIDVRVLPIQIEHRWQDIAAITPPLPCADYLAVTTRSLFLVTATTVTSYRRGRGLVICSRREAVELSPSGPRLVGIRVAKGLGGYPPVRRSSMLLATSSQTAAKSRSSCLPKTFSGFSASRRYVAASCRR